MPVGNSRESMRSHHKGLSVAIKVQCNNCEKILKAPDSAGGQATKCPQCGATIQIPDARPTPKGGADDGESEDSGAGYKIGAVVVTKKVAERCWSCSIPVSPTDIDCPECGAGLKSGKSRKPPATRKKKRKKKVVEKDDWRESLFGAFRYAFVAVLRGNGWQCCLWCAAVMLVLTIVPGIVGLLLMCIPFAGPLLYVGLVLVLAGAAPAGILSRNMEISSRYGARREMTGWEMSPTDEMIPSSIELVKANLVLSLLPLIFAGFVATSLGSFSTMSFGPSPGLGSVTTIATGLAYILVALACSFCAPMCIMLLGAGSVDAAIYPPNVFKVLTRTFAEYLAFYFYIGLLAVVTYVLGYVLAALVFLLVGATSIAGVWDSGGVMTMTVFALAALSALYVVCLVATYFSAMVGWSMGIFIHRNYEHFEAIRE